jgi:hypothetical protein
MNRRRSRFLEATGRKRFGVFGRVARPASLAALLSCIGAGCDTKAPEVSTVKPEQVFAPPGPGHAGQTPQGIESRSKGDAVSDALAVIHDQLQDMKAAYRDKAKIEGDLKQVAEQMRPLIEASRSHCDAMRRAAEDLRVQLPLARDGYASSALSYRQRAATYQDPHFREITLKLADEFDRMATETPKRLEALEGFLKELRDADVFLSETDRCVKDTAVALEIFSAHAKAPEVPVDAKAFSYRLGQFINTALEYEDKLLQKPPKPPEAPPAKEPASPPARAAAGKTTDSSVISLEELHRQTALRMLKPADSARFTEEAPAPTPPRPRAEERPPADLLRPGAVLEGSFRQGPYTIPCRLTVLRRDGERFTARLFAQNPDGPCESEAWGSVRGDVITMASRRVYGNISTRSEYHARIGTDGISGRCNEGTSCASEFSLAMTRR